MVPTINANARARDITFEFHDSCNCCCFGRRTEPDPNTQVYVSEQGQVSELDKSRVSNERAAVQQSIENLSHIVDQMIEDRKLERQELLHQISDKIKSVRENVPPSLTVADVKEIVSKVKDDSSSDQSNSPTPFFPWW